jgi:hypothetical protein
VVILAWAVARLVVVLRALARVLGVMAVVHVLIVTVVWLVVISIVIGVVIVLWGEPQLQQKGRAGCSGKVTQSRLGMEQQMGVSHTD